MDQVAPAQPRLLTAADLIRRSNRFTALCAPLTVSADDVVKLPRVYRGLYEQYFIPHLLRAGCANLDNVGWDWVDDTNTVTTKYPVHAVVVDHPFGVDLARQLMATSRLLESDGEHSYELLPVPQQDATWFRRIQLITQDLRWKPKRPWPPVGVMVTELIAYPAGNQANWVGAVLAGSVEQRTRLRQIWKDNLRIVGNPEPPYLGSGY